MLDFIIIAAPRTGSNHFCTLLNGAPGVVAHYEILHPHGVWFAGDTGAAATLGEITVEERDADLSRFLWRVKNADGCRAVGCKIFPGHSPDLTRRLLADRLVKKVVLYRQNLLAMYASTQIAAASNKFHHAADDRQAHFDGEDFEAFAQSTRAWYHSCTSTLAESGQAFFFVPYEMLSSASLIAGAQSFVSGRPSNGAAQSDHAKMGAQDVLARFSNREDVQSYIEANGFAHWSYDAGWSAAG